jgi:hypothetical protein
LTTSTSTPPAPNRITGPNWRSTELPTISSYPLSLTICWTVTPSNASGPALRDTLPRMLSKALQTAASSPRLSITPPTSLLWVTVVESNLSTTGKPTCLAAFTAASIVAQAMLCTTGMP